MAFIRPGGFRILLVVGFVLLLAAGVGGSWFYLTFLRDLPALKSIEDFQPPLASRVLDRDGRPIGEFYNQRRYIAPLSSIPEHTRMAFVAAEDTNFFSHAGIDYRAIARAAWVDVRAGEIKEGASTITMQLVKQLLLSPERKFRRKIREMILARQIEQRFTKNEILYLYLNEIYFGHGAWGIAEAARSYFDKSVGDLTVSESALLAGLPQRPSEYSPFADPQAAERRRRSVIGRMLGMGALDQAGYETALEDLPVLASPERNPDYEIAGYFAEEVRRHLFGRLGGDTVLNGGLVIETTLDLELQRAAAKSIERGLAEHDRRYGYRGPVRRVEPGAIDAELVALQEENADVLPAAEEDAALADAAASEDGDDSTAAGDVAERKDEERKDEERKQKEREDEEAADTAEAEIVEAVRLPVGERLLGVVTEVSRNTQTAQVAFAPDVTAEVFLEDVDWARVPHPKQPPRPVKKIRHIFKRGDVSWFTVVADGASKAPYPDETEVEDGEEPAPQPQRVELFQEPLVEGALLSFEVSTGNVLAMVGGREFANSEFNRATQARRQPGSAFKPFIYAAALERDYTPVSTIYDRPVVIEDQDSGFVWRPKNYGRHFYGPMTMRKALAKSVNNATVHLFRDLGVDYVIDYAQRLGIRSPLSRDLTLALGSSDVSLLELTAAYSIFPNRGRRVLPRFITRVTDRNGTVLLENVLLGAPTKPDASPVTAAAGPPASAEDGTPELIAKAASAAEHAEVIENEAEDSDQVISEAEAFLMCDLLSAVVQEGTGRGVKRLNAYLGGKTGTTNDQADAWFLGFSPDVATGVWVGYDSVKRLGWGETGAKTALPIWRTYMGAALAERAVRDFDAPPGIVFERIDRESGLLADATSKDAYFQPFLEDTAPTEYASKRMSATDTRRALREDAFQ
jgi:penicillin-binding protein 1A